MAYDFLGIGKPPVSKEEHAYSVLREAILSGRLKPGQELIQTEIARALGMSPIPVRMAIGRLIAEGLVVQEPHRTPSVAPLSPDILEEVLVIRMHLELLALKLAIPEITPEVLQDLEQLYEEMEEALRNDDMPRYGVLNKEFHLQMYESCRYSLLKQMIRDLWDKSDRFRSRSMFALIPHLAEQSHRDHLMLLELIRRRDTEKAVKLLEEHKGRARLSLLNYLRSASPASEIDG